MSTIPGVSLPLPVGADPQIKSKPKRSKKKSSPSAPTILSPPLTSAAPPANPSLEGKAEVESTSAPAPAAAPVPAGNVTGTKEKGPVEEVIAKRMRQLGKKLQRYRTYATGPPEGLNADQRGALASLPLLEGIYRELEDLSKQVEYVELEQAGKVREIRESARKEGEASADFKVSAFQEGLITPLSLFLRLYALLHPARSSDHEHLTFARLDLPSNLHDEVQATDVLRVGRMYEDLIAGGQSAKSVIDGLVKGSTGDDEENDHVHHLLNLLTQSSGASLEPEAEPKTETDGQITQVGNGDNSADGPQVETLESKAPSENGLPGDTTAATEPTATVPGGTFNFLQEDELAEEDTFEVVPHLAAHQTDGQQPPPESESVIESPAPVPAPASVPSPAPATEPAPATSGSGIFTPTPHFDWAADEDEDDAIGNQQIRDAWALGSTTGNDAAPAGKVEEETVQFEEKPAVALVQENELATADSTELTAADVPTSVDATSASMPTSQGSSSSPVTASPAAGTTSARSPRVQNQKGQQRQLNTSQKQPQHPLPKIPQKPLIDNDGFQVVGRIPSTSNSPAAGRGRGRGRPGNRGRGGAGRGGNGNAGSNGGRVRQPSTAGTQPQQQQQRQPRRDGPGQRPQGQNRQPSQIQSQTQGQGQPKTPVA